MDAPRYGFKAFYNSCEFDVYAESLLAAKKKAIEHFKPPKSKHHMVTVVLCEKDGQTVTHSTAEFG